MDGKGKRPLVVIADVVANDDLVPDLVEGEGATDNVGVVQLVVVADPGAGEPPELLDHWRSTPCSDFLGLAT